MNPYIYLGAVLVWLASLTGVGAWQRHDGRVAERTAWQGRETAQLAAANESIHTLTTAARNAEKASALAMAEVGTSYERKLSNATQQRAADRAALAAGALRLYDRATPRLNPDQCHLPGTGPASGLRDGGAPGELSPAASGFLLALAGDADAVAEQLAACQQVIVRMRLP